MLNIVKIRSIRTSLLAMSAIAMVNASALNSGAFAQSTPPVSQAGTPPTGGAPQTDRTSEIFRGSGAFMASRPDKHISSATPTDDGGITLNFVNAPVQDVLKAVLGDFLGLNYTVGAAVQGAVTIQTSRPVPKSEVLSILEQAFRLNGLALVNNKGMYRLVSLGDAPSQSGLRAHLSSQGGSNSGFGLEVVPLQYIAAEEMQRLIEPLAPTHAIVHADAARNFLIIEGTETERGAILDSIALFDVDWLKGMSFALYTPKFTDARGLASEVTAVIGGAKGPLAGMVRLVPIERLNAVLAITSQPRYLEELQTWVDRLDRPGEGSGRRIYVYSVQNGRAASLSSVLKKVLFGSTGSGTDQSQDNSATNDDAARPAPEHAGGAPQPAMAPVQPVLSQQIPSGASGNGAISAQATITADETNNALVVYATPQEYGVIQSALHQLDIVPLQVMLEAAIAEVTLNDKLSYGVQYFYQPNGENQIAQSTTGSLNISPAAPGFSYLFTQGTNIRVVLNALSAVTNVEVISSPELLVLNNHTATLQVGDQVPIATAQAVSVVASQAPIVNSIQYHDTGVILKITPRVNQGGMVMLEISQEVSGVTPTTSSTLDSPTIQQRRIESTVAVQNDETIALGGLIQDSKSRGSTGLPFLSEIPVLGGLFGQKDNNKTKTELLVLITPHIVNSVQKARAVTQELRQRLPRVQSILKDFGR